MRKWGEGFPGVCENNVMIPRSQPSKYCIHICKTAHENDIHTEKVKDSEWKKKKNENVNGTKLRERKKKKVGNQRNIN